MKKLLIILTILTFSSLTWGNQRFTGKCTASGNVTTSGLSSTNTADITYASATVTVSIVGGGLATIFSDNAGTPLSNPFTASSDATFDFYAANGRYSVTCSGTGVPTTVINGDALLNDPASTPTSSNILIPEGACSGAAIGLDVLCADSGTHSFKSSYNNGSFVGIPQLAGDLGNTTTSPQVTSTHISGITNNTIQKANSTGNMVNTSCTDNGTLVSCTEPLSSSSTSNSTFPNINGRLQIGSGSGQYSTIQACLNACNSNGGGSCTTPPNYTETLSANITLKQSCILNLPSLYTINMGSNQVTCASGACNGAGIVAEAPPANGTNGFIYTGTGDAFSIGDTLGVTSDIRLDNIKVLINTAGASAIGIHLKQVVKYQMVNPAVIGSGPSNSQDCIDLDGNGSNYTGSGYIYNPDVESCNTAILLTGSGTNAGNQNIIIGGNTSSSAATCLDFEASSSGNQVIDFDCEASTGPAVKIGAGANGNRITLWNAGNNSDFQFGASTFSNILDCIANPCVPGTDAGKTNIAQYGTQVINNGLAAADVGSFSGWGSGPSPSVVIGGGTNSFAQVCITAGGSPAGNPSAVLTYHGGASMSNSSSVILSRSDNAAPLSATWLVASRTATGFTFVFVGSPVGASTYCFDFKAGPR